MSSKAVPPLGVHPDLPKSTGERKAAETDASARRILDDEAERRRAKSARLKKARLASEAKEADAKTDEAPKTRRKAGAKAKKPV